METEIIKPFLEQGILGAGWVLAIYFIWRRDALLREVLTAMSESTAANKDVAKSVERLSASIGGQQ